MIKYEQRLTNQDPKSVSQISSLQLIFMILVDI